MMTAVHAPVEGFNGTVVGVTFVEGVGETGDDNALAYFARHGYNVGGNTGGDIESMTVAQLHEFAAGHGIDLGDATRKADIVDAIRTAQSADDAPTGGDD